MSAAWLIWIIDKVLAGLRKLASILFARRRRTPIQITFPEPGTDLKAVQRVVVVGTVPRKEHLHLFVVDPSGRFHPQTNMMTGTDHTLVAYLDKTRLIAPGDYDLVAALADESADRSIQRYLDEDGPATKWQGMSGLPEGCKSGHIVTVRRDGKSP